MVFAPTEADWSNAVFAAKRASSYGGRVLDYGCGRGETLSNLLDMGVDAYGADIFFDGMDWSDPDTFVNRQVTEGRVKEIVDGKLAFPDDYFSVVMSDQVLEHVTDLEAVIAECSRVLAPGGVMIHQYPALQVVREAHVGTPFAHRLRGRAQVDSIVVSGYLKMGKHKNADESTAEWAARMAEWVNEFCHYRPRSDVESCIRSHGFTVRHDEISYCLERSKSKPLVHRMVKSTPAVSSALFRAIGFDVVVCTGVSQTSP